MMLEKSEASKYSAKLLRKKKVARDTMAFYFEKPVNLTFFAGQSMRLYSPQNELDGRTITIASAPHENHLLFVMRMRGSDFKNALEGIKGGDRIELEGPYGSRFILHEDLNTPAVFIAGGIGITPFLSMIKHATHYKSGYKMTLFYSNKREEDIAFRDELEKAKKENTNFNYVLTLTRKTPNKWSGGIGRITKAMVDKYMAQSAEAIFYIAGPPTMVVGMTDTLEKSGIDSNHILTKKFTGYDS